MLETTKKKSEQNKTGRSFKTQLDPFVLIVVALASLLIFLHFYMDSVLSEKRRVVSCHSSSLVASDALDESINDVEYYEFLFKTCMREAGYAL
ncbi:MAG: hypothetical protein WDZ75_01415 [Candidatus Paceibacterota bacterium]